MKIYLPSDLQEFVAEKVESGAYHSASEVISQALRLLKDWDALRECRLEELRREIQIGLDQADRGEVAPLDIEAIKAEGRRRLEEERKAQ